MDKSTKSAEFKMVGYGTFRRKFIQRGKFLKDGSHDPNARKDLLMSILVAKLGCQKLVHTNSFMNGGVSSSTVCRHLNEHKTVTNFKFQLTSCIDTVGLKSIGNNMQNLLASDQVAAIVPRNKVSGKQMKITVSLHVDGVNTDNKLNVDSSVIPHQVTGVCRH